MALIKNKLAIKHNIYDKEPGYVIIGEMAALICFFDR